MKEIKATLYKIDGTKEPLILTKKTSLKTLQKLVGGLIEIIYIIPFVDEIKENFDKGKDLVINESGKLLDLPINPWSFLITFHTRWHGEVFRGNIILVDGQLP